MIRRLLLVALALSASLAHADSDSPANLPTDRSPLEDLALVDPASVLRELPALLEQAQQRGDAHEQALLYLARANACRVSGDWRCQQEAGAAAMAVADRAKLTTLAIRGRIHNARAAIAMRDYARAENVLSAADTMNDAQAEPALAGEIDLAWSSLSQNLGKFEVAIAYANKGIGHLQRRDDPFLRSRLLRNRARAEIQLGRYDAAEHTLGNALAISEKLEDPKLSAELLLEQARLAHATGDLVQQQARGERVLALARELDNPQLDAQGHEVLGLAAIGRGDPARALAELSRAESGFRTLALDQDRMRVLRELIRVGLANKAPPENMNRWAADLVALDETILDRERASAADNFEQRLDYVRRGFELTAAKERAQADRERADGLARTSELTFIAIVLGGLLLVVAAVFLWRLRAINRTLADALAREHDSEARFRLLADNARDLIVRLDVLGRRLYVSPSVRDLLGIEPEAFADPAWDGIHADDREPLRLALDALMKDGGESRTTFRVRHRDGRTVWLEALGRRVPALDRDSEYEIIYSARDVTAHVQAEAALADSQRQLRDVTDNIPAVIGRFDREQRYLFVNGYASRMFGRTPAEVLGRTLREVRGEAIYATIRPHVEQVLAGQQVTFEAEALVGGTRYNFQSMYVPDRDDQGKVRGFYAITHDITRLKQAERELERLAGYDSLTGVANRRHFEQSLAIAVAHSQRHDRPLALLYLDLDRFKPINDAHGHAVGDEVICGFAQRLSASVRAVDLVARVGGDEFVVLIDEPGAIDDITGIARALVARMNEPVPTRAGPLTITASIGIAYARRADDGQELLLRADRALYQAKDAGRNTWRVAPELV